jgi:hypothetical protein
MIKTVIVFAFIILITSAFFNCKPNKLLQYKMNYKKAYVYDFKIKYLKKLLSEGFNNSGEIKAILLYDHSKGLSDPALSMDDFKLIDSFAKIGNLEMVRDSLTKVGRAEGAGGKYVFSFALEKFNSKWLDSLANSRYKMYLLQL